MFALSDPGTMYAVHKRKRSLLITAPSTSTHRQPPLLSSSTALVVNSGRRRDRRAAAFVGSAIIFPGDQHGPDDAGHLGGMYGRPPFGKGFVGASASGSGAVMYPAFVRGAMTAGPEGVRDRVPIIPARCDRKS